MQDHIVKYPRTPHMEGSKLQPGDDGSDQASLAEIAKAWPGCKMIIEEKLDGANSGLSFSEDLDLRLQSRGHFLTGGAREAQFNLFKEWARVHEASFMERLENRFILYGEWCFARHTQFYDALPHYFHEFDVFDTKTGVFLSTEARRDLLDGLPIVSVPVLADTWPGSRKEFLSLVTKSAYRSDEWHSNLKSAAEEAGVDADQTLAECGQDADLMEGLYIKIERGAETVARYKWVRPGFIQAITEGGIHWSQRPMIRNGLAEGVDLFSQPGQMAVEP